MSSRDSSPAEAHVTKVLAVVGEPGTREALQASLKGREYRIYFAADCSEVAAAVAEHGCDVLVVDSALLARDAHRAGTSLDVVPRIPLVTISSGPDNGPQAAADGADVYESIARPIAREELIRAVRRAAERKRLLDEKLGVQDARAGYRQSSPDEAAPRPTDLDRVNQELKTLTRIGREVSATLDLTQVLKRVTELAADVCGAHRCTIVLIGRDGQMLTPAMSGFSDGHRDEDLWHLFTDKSYPVPLSDVPEAQQVIRDQSPLFVGDAEGSSLPRHLIEPFGIKSVLLVPLVSKKWIVGVMALDHVEEGRSFSARQIDMAMTIASQATLAIENARLYEQARRQARHSALLNKVAEQTNAMVEPERLLPSVCRTIHEHFRYDSVYLMLLDGDGLVVGGKAGTGAEIVPDDYRQPLDRGILGWVARHGDRLVSNNVGEEERYFAPFPDRYQAGSELAVPLKIEGEVVGVLDLQCRQRGAFDELDIATACTLAEQIASGLQNSRLYDQARRRAVRLQAAVEVARGATAILDVDQLLSETVHLICARFGFYHAGVYLLDEKGRRATLRAAYSRGDRGLVSLGHELAVEGSAADGGPVSEVARTGVPRIASVTGAGGAAGTTLGLPNTRSEMALPLISRGTVIGVLNVQSTEKDAFGSEDGATLQAMADQLANALENARLYEAAQRRVAELEAVRQAGLHVTSSLELQPVLEAILKSALQLVSAADAHVFLYEDGRARFGAATWAGQNQEEPYADPRPDGVTYTVARSGERLVISDTGTHPLFQDRDYAGWRGAILGLPLRIGNQVQGVMNIAFDEPHNFSDEELNVLGLLADQAAIAVENARLYKEEQRRVEELIVLRNIDLAITSTLSLDEVLDRVYRQLSRLMDVTTFYIGLYDSKKNVLRLSLIVDRGTRLDPVTLDLADDGGFAGWVVRNKEPLWIGDWEREQDTLPAEGIAQGRPTRSLMVLPLLARGEPVGVISAQSYEPDAFDQGHHRLFAGISNQVAIAVENARLFEQVRRRLREMRLLQRIILAASSTLDFEEVLAGTIEILRETLDIEHVAFVLPDGEEARAIVAPGSRPAAEREDDGHVRADSQIVSRVYHTGEAELFTDVSEASSPAEAWAGEPSELAVPVWDGEEVVAVLYARSPQLHDFDEDDLSLFSAVAAQLGVVLRNARLFDQTRRRLTETRLLQQVMQAGAISLDFDTALERTVHALHNMLGIDHLSFALPVDDGTALKLHPSQIGYASEMAQVRIPLNRSVAGRAYATGETQLIPDVRQTPFYYEGAPEVRSELNVPVQVAGRVIAVLNAESPRTNAFDDDDLRLFEAVAAQLGIVLENARLYQRLQEQRDKLGQAYDELKEIDRLRTELVQNVSHELRTPFTLVQGYIELMMEGDLGPITEQQQEALRIVRKRVDTLQRRTRDLTTLDSLSREKPSLRPISMLDAARRAVDDLKPQARRAGVHVHADLPDALPPVAADPEHLAQAFTHLIDNAIKFSPDGGTVTLRAWTDDGRSCVAVSDEGIGIRQEHLDRIFERFYQVDGSINRRFSGMGIGLALVWEIVEVYGGNVSVSSSPRTGSTFVVSLPHATAEAAPPPQAGRRRPTVDTLSETGQGRNS